MINKIKKRDGSLEDFTLEKITNAIFLAAKSVGGENQELSANLSKQVIDYMNNNDDSTIPTVEDIQDSVEKVLIENGHAKTAKAFILYRERKSNIRSQKAQMGVKDDMKLTVNSIRVLKSRYLRKDESGNTIETPGQLFKRVADNIASAELKYGKSNEQVEQIRDEFYEALSTLSFVPNSPTLMNAGTPMQQLSACFVLPIDDSMEGIFDSVKATALIHQSGGGTGFSFSRLRPKGDAVRSTGGVASGPISFMRVFNAATEVIKQGGKRRGANMGILRVDHPDIMDFIQCKQKEGDLNNFNISVAITDKFMEAVKNDTTYELLNPRSRKPIKELKAKKVFDLITTLAWNNGEPGIVFIDRINRDNPTPALGEIEATNPCGEQPLLPYESCNLGHINLTKMVKNGEVDWDEIKRLVWLGIRFLDNVVDMNKFPMERITEMVQGNRKVGLGVMGFADMLIQIGIPYNSQEAVDMADKVMSFISQEAKKASIDLANEKGSFPNIDRSLFSDQQMRNACLTTIAPTGTTSIIANSSSGIEPLFAVSFVRRNVLNDEEMIETNPIFEKIAKERGFYSNELMKKISRSGSIQGYDEIPDDVKRVFVTSLEIDPVWHIKIQAAFQKHIDNAVSKTINFPNDATIDDIAQAYLLSYKLGCKGITVYRYGSRDMQVLNIEKKKEEPKQELCPDCKSPLAIEEGCAKCPSCGFSRCSV